MTTFPTEEQPDRRRAAASHEQKPEKKPNTAPQKPHVAPAKGRRGRRPVPAKERPKRPASPKPPRPPKARRHGAAREGSKTAKVLELREAARRRHPEADHQIHRLAAAQCSGLHQRHTRQEDGARRRIHKGRRRGARLQRSEVAPVRSGPPGSGRGGPFCFVEPLSPAVGPQGQPPPSRQRGPTGAQRRLPQMALAFLPGPPGFGCGGLFSIDAARFPLIFGARRVMNRRSRTRATG